MVKRISRPKALHTVMTILPFGEKRPVIASDAYVHSSATVIGEVHLHEGSSVWPGAVVRADDARIDIGKNSAVLDLALLEAPKGKPIVLGEGCIVSHAARLHGCVVMADSLVGIGATVLDGAMIGKGCVIAAGALVAPDAKIPPGSFVVGIPGKVSREATPEERRFVQEEVRHIAEKVKVYRSGA